MPLETLPQVDFSAGMFRSIARYLVPESGAWDIRNGLLDEDGTVYRRGGAEYLSTSAFDTSLSFIWDGVLAPGQRTLIASTEQFAFLESDEAPHSAGGAGLAVPKRAVEFDDIVFVGGGTLYGGSRKQADYSDGTVSVTNDSAAVTGSSTAWLANVDAGMLLQVGGADRYYVVQSVESDTELTLADEYQGSTAAGQAYTLTRLGEASTPYINSGIYAVAGGRLFAALGHKLRFSNRNDPHTFDPLDFHEFTEDVIGAEGIRDNLLVFTTDGLWLLSGIPLDLIDEFGNPQHRLEHVSRDLVLVSHEGIASWAGSAIAPCADGVWLLDGVSSPEVLTRSIADLWRSYIARGYRTGQAQVIRSHYFLPIISQGGTVRDVLVCRLDRPIQTRIGTVYPWMRLGGQVGKCAAFAIRTGGATSARNPQLLGADTRSARVLSLNSLFTPSAEVKSDPDGTVFDLEIETRDFSTGDGFNENFVRKLRTRYELVAASSDNPSLKAYMRGEGTATGSGSTWGAFSWGEGKWGPPGEAWDELTPDASTDTGENPHTWRVGKRRRHIRFRLESSGPAASLVLRTMQLFIRSSRKA